MSEPIEVVRAREARQQRAFDTRGDPVLTIGCPRCQTRRGEVYPTAEGLAVVLLSSTSATHSKLKRARLNRLRRGDESPEILEPLPGDETTDPVSPRDLAKALDRFERVFTVMLDDPIEQPVRCPCSNDEYRLDYAAVGVAVLTPKTRWISLTRLTTPLN